MSDAVQARPSAPRWKRRRVELLMQVSLVIFGALLAFGFGQWKEQRDEQARARVALESIRSELRTNREEVERARRYHAMLADRFEQLEQRGAVQPGWDDFPQGLLSPARVVSTAWQSAMTTGAAARWPYRELLTLSSIYEAQASYARLSDALLASTYQDLMRNGPSQLLDGYANFVPVQRDFSGKESELVAAYDEALDAIGD
jgi:type II secretory pathway pseudopilin PulG